MKTAHPIRALLLVLTFVLGPVASFAQASDDQAAGNPTPDNPAADSRVPDYQTSDNRAADARPPDNQAPDYQTPDYGTPGGEVSVASAPPPLPSYEQPPVPGPGYLWTPGYWAYAVDAGYYWVPGTWVLPPFVGVLWTPGYWGWGGGFFNFHRGYWGPRVGFYGGINYGCGYFGVGFAGGYWRGREFFYNRAVTNIRNTSITNVYNNTAVNRGFGNGRVSHNGGPGGVNLRPSAVEQAAARAARYAPTNEQRNHEWAAHGVPALRSSVNHGQPAIAATARAGVFAGHDIAAQRRTTGAGTSPVGRTGQRTPAPLTRGASINRTADRPPWAYRGAQHDTAAPQQLQRKPASTAQPAAAYRPGQPPVGGMRTARQGYDYPRAARQPAARWTAPARPAPSYTQRASHAPTYAALAPNAGRGAARPPANFGSPNRGAPARAGTQSASHGPRHG